jgi:hypothetical protein
LGEAAAVDEGSFHIPPARRGGSLGDVDLSDARAAEPGAVYGMNCGDPGFKRRCVLTYLRRSS